MIKKGHTMPVNPNEDKQIETQESMYQERYGESFGTAHAREALRSLRHIPYYARQFDRFIEKHGEAKV